MPLPWVRLDSNIASHDKVLNLLSDPSNKKWQAIASYMFALGYCGEHETDGHVPMAALPFVHGNRVTARLLVKYGLWDENGAGWRVRNFEVRQPLKVSIEEVRASRQRAAKKANCVRWHGPSCGCWKGD